MKDKKHSAKKLAAMKADELFPSLLSAEQHDSVQAVKKKKKAKKGVVENSMINSYYVAGASDEVPEVFTGEEADFDIIKHMRKAEDPVTGTLRDLRIDDGDMKRAKNYYDFSFNILGKDVHPPWSRQLWIGMMLFGEVCPRCSNKKWLDVNNVPKDYPAKEMPEHLQFLEYGVCPKCKSTKWELIRDHGLKHYLQLDNVLGQRSGKSSSAGGGYAPYVAHRYLTFPNLATMSKSMQASTELTMTFVSLNFAKAVGVLWTPFRKTIENSSWFKEYFSLLDFYKNKYGKELYRSSTLYMSFFHKNLRFYPSGPRSSTLRGDCLTGDTLVNTSAGFVHFEELQFRKGLHPTRDTVDSPLGPKAVSHTYKKVDREIIQVKTRNGFMLKGTPEHPVLVLTPELDYKWVRLDAVQEGMWIVSRTRMNKPLFGDNQLLNKDKATILGNFTANGYRTSISSNDEKVIRRFNRAVKNTTGRNSRREHRDPKLASDNHWVLANGRNTKGSFLDTLRSWGYDPYALAAQKQIPFSVRTSPREILHEYLEAYFSCDCGINGGATAKQKRNGGTTSPEVELSSASIKLIRQLQVILLQVYGLVGRIGKLVEYKNMSRVRFKRKRYVTWQLTLTGYDAYRFVKTFRRAKLQKYAARFKDVPAGFASDRRKLPYVREHMLAFWSNLNGRMNHTLEDGTQVRKSPRPLIVAGGKDASHAAEYRLYADKNMPQILEFMRVVNPDLWRKIEHFYRLRAHYEEVVSVKAHTGKTTVYDITVPDGHAFTANGLSSHNTRIGALLDELGLFPLPTGDQEEDENSERANADEAHKSLLNSLTTVSATNLKLLKQGQSFAPPAVMMCVSSPISQRDKVMRLLRESKTDEGSKTILGINMPTWEMNPDLDRDSPVIASAYASNWEKAERDFGANPPMIHSTYVGRGTYEDGLFVGNKNTHRLKYMLDRPGEIYGHIERIGTVKWPSLVTIDAGHKNNSFSIVGGHFDFDNQKTVVSTLIEVMALEKRSINFNLLYKYIILPLCRDLNAVAMLADQWQSVDLLYRIEQDMGNNPLGKPRVRAKQHSPRRKDFDNVVAMMNNRSILLPVFRNEDKQRVLDGSIEDWASELMNKPEAHLMLQMATVKNVGEERCPEKGDGFTDDLWRAFILFASKLHEPKVFERLVEAKDFNYSNGRVKGPMPVFVGRSGGGIALPNGLRQGLTQQRGFSNNNIESSGITLNTDIDALLRDNGG